MRLSRAAGATLLALHAGPAPAQGPPPAAPPTAVPPAPTAAAPTSPTAPPPPTATAASPATTATAPPAPPSAGAPAAPPLGRPGLVAGKSLAKATYMERVTAKLILKRGLVALNEGRLEAALEAFEAAYRQVADPEVRLVMAMAIRRLGRTLDAYEDLPAVIAEAEAAIAVDAKYGAIAAAAREELASMTPEVGFVILAGLESVPADAELSINDREIPRERWAGRIAVLPGKLAVDVTGQPTREFSVAAGKQVRINLAATVAHQPSAAVTPETLRDPEPVAPPPDAETAPPARLIAGIASGGVGVVGLALYAVFGGLALSRKNDLDVACPSNNCPDDVADLIDEGQSFQTMANVFFTVGVVGLAAGGGLVIWHFVEPPETDSEDTPPAALVVAPASLGLRARF